VGCWDLVARVPKGSSCRPSFTLPTRRDLQTCRLAEPSTSQLDRPAASANCGSHAPCTLRTTHPSCCPKKPVTESAAVLQCCPSPPLALRAIWPGGRSAWPPHKGNLDPPIWDPFSSLLFSKQSIVQELVPYPSVVLFFLIASLFIPYSSWAHNTSHHTF
jgi:hypothetical protein